MCGPKEDGRDGCSELVRCSQCKPRQCESMTLFPTGILTST